MLFAGLSVFLTKSDFLIVWLKMNDECSVSLKKKQQTKQYMAMRNKVCVSLGMNFS